MKFSPFQEFHKFKESEYYTSMHWSKQPLLKTLEAAPKMLYAAKCTIMLQNFVILPKKAETISIKTTFKHYCQKIKNVESVQQLFLLL